MEGLSPVLLAILILFLLTSFLKIFTTLGLLTQGLGLGSGIGLPANTALALSLSLLVVAPQINAAGGLGKLIREASAAPDPYVYLDPLWRPYLEKHADKAIAAKFEQMRVSEPGSKVETSTPPENASPSVSFAALVPAYVISELRDAFELGFALLLPFVVVDLLVTNLMMLLGISHASPAVFSFPLKLLLFFSVDGWKLISEKLLSGYL